MSLVIPIKPGQWPEPVTIIEGQGDLPNPGDHSLEDVNAFNKRENVPVTEQLHIDNPNLPGPDQDGPDSITNEDRIPRRKGNPAWKSPAYYREEPRTSDRTQSSIVARPVS